MSKKLYLYPLWLRVWHAINGLICMLMIYSGFCMQNSGKEIFCLLNFERAVQVHNIGGILLVLNYLIFLILNGKTNNKRHYKIDRQEGWRNTRNQIHYYNKGFFQGEEAPFKVTIQEKFNPLQKVAYVTVMYVLMPILIVSGLGLLVPAIIVEEFPMDSGLHMVSLIHRVANVGLSAFLLIHIYSASLGHPPSCHFKSIITGWVQNSKKL